MVAVHIQLFSTYGLKLYIWALTLTNHLSLLPRYRNQQLNTILQSSYEWKKKNASTFNLLIICDTKMIWKLLSQREINEGMTHYYTSHYTTNMSKLYQNQCCHILQTKRLLKNIVTINLQFLSPEYLRMDTKAMACNNV